MTKEYFRNYGNGRFDVKNRKQIKAMAKDAEFNKLSEKWCVRSLKHQYPHHFTWLGRPILQFPQDVIAMQEIIWKVKPEVIIETGVARGGSLIFYASMLKLLGNHGEVVGIEIALRKHNRDALKKHPFSKKIKIVDGSSVDPKVAMRVHDYVGGRKAMVVLDSNHLGSHVLQEMNLYSDLVTKGSYLIVSDTFLESFPPGFFPNRPWDKGDNPATAVYEFMKTNKRFKNDEELVNKLGITSCPVGYLKCIRN
jgi:cephalosporin hydroxylase